MGMIIAVIIGGLHDTVIAQAPPRPGTVLEPGKGQITFRVKGDELPAPEIVEVTALRPPKEGDKPEDIKSFPKTGQKVVEFKSSFKFAEGTSASDIAFFFSNRLDEACFDPERETGSKSIFCENIFRLDGSSKRADGKGSSVEITFGGSAPLMPGPRPDRPYPPGWKPRDQERKHHRFGFGLGLEFGEFNRGGTLRIFAGGFIREKGLQVGGEARAAQLLNVVIPMAIELPTELPSGEPIQSAQQMVSYIAAILAREGWDVEMFGEAECIIYSCKLPNGEMMDLRSALFQYSGDGDYHFSITFYSTNLQRSKGK